MSTRKAIILALIILATCYATVQAQEGRSGTSASCSGTISTRTLDPAILKVIGPVRTPGVEANSSTRLASETVPFQLFQLGSEIPAADKDNAEPDQSDFGNIDGKDRELNVLVSVLKQPRLVVGLGNSVIASVCKGKSTGGGPTQNSVQSNGLLKDLNLSIIAMTPDASEVLGGEYEISFGIMIRYN